MYGIRRSELLLSIFPGWPMYGNIVPQRLLCFLLAGDDSVTHMITSTTGLNLNHGWVKGYRFETGPIPRPLPIEWAENTGRVMVYIIGDTVEWVNIVWRPLGDLLLNGQNNIVDNGDMSVTITADGIEETIVFDPEDEDFYAMLCSNPTIVEKLPGDPNNCFDARVGWKWNGESCYEAQ